MNDKVIKLVVGASIAVVSFYVGTEYQKVKMITEQMDTWRRMDNIAKNYRKLADLCVKGRGR